MKTQAKLPGFLPDIVSYLVDDRVGIVRHVGEFPKDSDGPDFFYFFARACNTKAFCQQKNYETAGGASTNREFALAKAIGEAVERYCAAIYEKEEFPFESYDSASRLCVSPDVFALYSREQYRQPSFPFVPFESTTPVCWTPAEELLTGTIYHVPAAMVFLPYFYDLTIGERPIVSPISTGLACHCTPEEAAISATCEVIERDSFTITWQARMPPPQIAIETLSEDNLDLVARFNRTGNGVTLFNITLEVGVPTILSVSRGAWAERPALTFSASADLDPERAVRKSLEELAYTLRLAQEMKSTLDPLIPTGNFGNIVDQHSHVHLYCGEKNARLADFLFSSKKRISFDDIENFSTDDPKHDLQRLGEKLFSVNYELLLADLTTPDVQELGLSVVRALIPGFHPLVMGHRLRALGGTRLWVIPQKLGYQGINKESGDNQAPHPFP